MAASSVHAPPLTRLALGSRCVPRRHTALCLLRAMWGIGLAGTVNLYSSQSLNFVHGDRKSRY
eukprot:3234563-Prymnesium_polylepis.1